MLSFIEFLNETKQSNSLTKADEFFNMLCESEQLDEGFKDTLKLLEDDGYIALVGSKKAPTIRLIANEV